MVTRSDLVSIINGLKVVFLIAALAGTTIYVANPNIQTRVLNLAREIEDVGNGGSEQCKKERGKWNARDDTCEMPRSTTTDDTSSAKKPGGGGKKFNTRPKCEREGGFWTNNVCYLMGEDVPGGYEVCNHSSSGASGVYLCKKEIPPPAPGQPPDGTGQGGAETEPPKYCTFQGGNGQYYTIAPGESVAGGGSYFINNDPNQPRVANQVCDDGELKECTSALKDKYPQLGECTNPTIAPGGSSYAAKAGGASCNSGGLLLPNNRLTGDGQGGFQQCQNGQLVPSPLDPNAVNNFLITGQSAPDNLATACKDSGQDCSNLTAFAESWLQTALPDQYQNLPAAREAYQNQLLVMVVMDQTYKVTAQDTVILDFCELNNIPNCVGKTTSQVLSDYCQNQPDHDDCLFPRDYIIDNKLDPALADQAKEINHLNNISTQGSLYRVYTNTNPSNEDLSEARVLCQQSAADKSKCDENSYLQVFSGGALNQLNSEYFQIADTYLKTQAPPSAVTQPAPCPPSPRGYARTEVYDANGQHKCISAVPEKTNTASLGTISQSNFPMGNVPGVSTSTTTACGGSLQTCCRAGFGTSVSFNGDNKNECNTGLSCGTSGKCEYDTALAQAAAVIRLAEADPENFKTIIANNSQDPAVTAKLNEATDTTNTPCSGAWTYSATSKDLICVTNEVLEQAYYTQPKSAVYPDSGNLNQACRWDWGNLNFHACNNDMLACTADNTCQLNEPAKNLLAAGESQFNLTTINSPGLSLSQNTSLAESGCTQDDSTYAQNGGCFRCLNAAVHSLQRMPSAEYCDPNSQLAAGLPKIKPAVAPTTKYVGKFNTPQAFCPEGLVLIDNLCLDPIAAAFTPGYNQGVTASNIRENPIINAIPIVNFLVDHIVAPIFAAIPGSSYYRAAQTQADVAYSMLADRPTNVSVDDILATVSPSARVYVHLDVLNSQPADPQNFASGLYAALGYTSLFTSAWTEGLAGPDQNAFYNYAATYADPNATFGQKAGSAALFGTEIAFVAADLIPVNKVFTATAKATKTVPILGKVFSFPHAVQLAFDASRPGRVVTGLMEMAASPLMALGGGNIKPIQYFIHGLGLVTGNVPLPKQGFTELAQKSVDNALPAPKIVDVDTIGDDIRGQQLAFKPPEPAPLSDNLATQKFTLEDNGQPLTYITHNDQGIVTIEPIGANQVSVNGQTVSQPTTLASINEGQITINGQRYQFDGFDLQNNTPVVFRLEQPIGIARVIDPAPPAQVTGTIDPGYQTKNPQFSGSDNFFADADTAAGIQLGRAENGTPVIYRQNPPIYYFDEAGNRWVETSTVELREGLTIALNPKVINPDQNVRLEAQLMKVTTEDRKSVV